MEILGKIQKIFETRTFSTGFQKREFVVLTEETYPQEIIIEIVKDRIDLLDRFKEGDSVTVGINITGRSWESPQGEVKYFNTINAWKIVKRT